MRCWLCSAEQGWRTDVQECLGSRGVAVALAVEDSNPTVQIAAVRRVLDDLAGGARGL
ncbi:hypothetical protein ACTMU2_31655 [Cupriavidus basilensis]